MLRKELISCLVETPKPFVFFWCIQRASGVDMALIGRVPDEEFVVANQTKVRDYVLVAFSGQSLPRNTEINFNMTTATPKDFPPQGVYKDVMNPATMNKLQINPPGSEWFGNIVINHQFSADILNTNIGHFINDDWMPRTSTLLVNVGGVVSLLNQLTQALSRGLAYAEERIAVKRRGRICRAVRRGRDCQGGLRVRRGSWGEAVHRRETCRNIYSGSSSCWSAIQTDSEHSENSSLHLRLQFRRPVGNYGKVGERKCDNKRVLRRSRNIETAILLGVPSGLGLASNAASFAEVA